MKAIPKMLAFVLAFAAVLAGGCSSIRSKTPPIEDVLHAGPLARVLVYVGNIPLGESGPSPDGMTVAIGGISTLSAQGRDANNRPIRVSPRWRASKPELVDISPAVGDMVAVKGLREGTVQIVAEHGGVKRTIDYVFVK